MGVHISVFEAGSVFKAVTVQAQAAHGAGCWQVLLQIPWGLKNKLWRVPDIPHAVDGHRSRCGTGDFVKKSGGSDCEMVSMPDAWHWVKALF